MSEVRCTKPLGGGVPGPSDLSAEEYRAEAALVQRSIEQPVFRSHLHYLEITGKSVQSASSTKIDARSCNGRCEADIVTEGFELPDGPGFGLFRIPFQVEVSAGIRVNLTVGEHVPGRGQDD